MRLRFLCQEKGVTLEQLKSSARGGEHYIANVRHLAFAALREEGLTLGEIGKIFNRDHSTVLYGINKVNGVGGKA